MLSRGDQVSQMEGRSVRSQVAGGLRLAFLSLYFMAAAIMLVAGVTYAFFPGEHSRVLGTVFMVLSVSAITTEFPRWVSALTGILSLAGLNAFIVLLSGHEFGSPSVRFPRPVALVFVVFFAAASHLSTTFKRSSLDHLDRIAATSFALGLAWLIAYSGNRTAYTGRPPRPDWVEWLTLGFCLTCLGGPWVRSRYRSREQRGRSRRRESASRLIG